MAGWPAEIGYARRWYEPAYQKLPKFADRG
jgi:hypothetical protein